MTAKGILAISVFAAAFCAAAESPYGAEVVKCVTGCTDARFNDPDNVLGEPSRFVKIYSGSWGGVGYSDVYGGVVHPAVPAYKGGVHLSLVSPDDEDPGYVVIAFDHDVVDDPYNPFGIDFIVFGNAGCTKSTTTGMTALDDPATCRLTAAGFPEESVVEVAQNPNGPWYGSARWRTSDGFAPTLGHVYDPANADTNLYSGNLWWGAPTDPTYPVDPRIDFSDCAGLTLAQLCQRYNGSAGGAGYDLADATGLPADTAHGGRKWFRYVKISCAEVDGEEGDFGFSEPEIDAVSDVAPVSGFRLWQLANYDWATVWNPSISGVDAIGANGKKNGLSYILGYSAADTFSLDFRISRFTQGDGHSDLEVLSNMTLPENSGIKIKSSSDLRNWTDELPSYLPTYVNGDGLTVNTLRVSGSGKFFKVVLEE